MGIIVGILLAVVIWWFLKLSLYTLIAFAVIGAFLGAIPRFMARKAK